MTKAEIITRNRFGELGIRMNKYLTSDRTWVAILLFYLCLIYFPLVLSNTAAQLKWLKGDCYYYRAVVVSLLQDGDLLLANNIDDHLNGLLALGKNGLVPKHPILMPLFSIPFYWLFNDKGLLLFNVVDCMVLMVLIFKLNRLFFDGYIAFAITALYATGTLFFDYVYNYSPDVFSTVLVVGALYFILQRKFYIGSFLLGLSVFAKISNTPLAGVMLGYMLLTIVREPGLGTNQTNSLVNKAATIITALSIFILALIPFGVTNYILFGSPFITGYQRTAGPGQNPGEIAARSEVAKFDLPVLKGAYLLLFDRYHGIIPTNPVTILAFVGLFLLPRKADERLYLLLAICAVQFIFFTKYDGSMASHFSNRYLMTFVALSSVFTGTFLMYISEKFVALKLAKPQFTRCEDGYQS